jgi:uncharacterized protein (TIGR02246 family)
MRALPRRAGFVLTALLMMLAACQVHVKTTPNPARDAGEIRARLDSTAAGWNRGDLAGYMAMYVDSAVAMGGAEADRGVAAIERSMKAGFWRTGRPAQVLRYENVEVKMLGEDYALVTGAFVLTGNGRPDRRGIFTTIWTRTGQGWRMMHDHSG